jgi:hypothetical protein
VSAEPIEPTPPDSLTGDYEVIHLGGEAAAVVPLHDIRLFQALSRRATADMLDEAELEVAAQEYEEWKAAGRPGAKSHEEFVTQLFEEAQDERFMANLLGEAQ